MLRILLALFAKRKQMLGRRVFRFLKHFQSILPGIGGDLTVKIYSFLSTNSTSITADRSERSEKMCFGMRFFSSLENSVRSPGARRLLRSLRAALEKFFTSFVGKVLLNMCIFVLTKDVTMIPKILPFLNRLLDRFFL